VKKSSHRNKGKQVAKKSSSTSAKSSLVHKPKKSGTSSRRKIAKSSLEPIPKKSDAGENEISSAIDCKENADMDLQLQLIPPEVKDDFHKIGFALFQGKSRIAILISPFEISQHPIRNEWERMFEKVRVRDIQCFMLHWGELIVFSLPVG